jgi:outer membrane protein assembly factor BamD (BamD/ComL family)
VNRAVIASGLSVALLLSLAISVGAQPAQPAPARAPVSATVTAPAVGVKAAVPAPPTVSVGVAAPAAPGVAAPAASGSPAVTATAAIGDGGVVGEGGVSANGLAPPTVTPTTATAPLARKLAPQLPPPTAAQLSALEALQGETDAYEKGAREYRDSVTTIVQLHYEEKKKEILSGLDREIATEKGELKKAREVAIVRLEEFIQKYSGARAQPVETPDAMYRLAALYEERARSEDATQDLSIGLKPAIKLYKQVITDFPKYRELAGIYYFLGHAYNDSNRIEEAEQVWRSLVCYNKYPYPTAPDPKNPDADTIKPLPQDNEEPYWSAWRNRHHDPKSVRRGGAETTFEDPYPSDCKSIDQPSLRLGEEPKYVAEVWWQIGNWEFDQQDVRGGFVKEEPAAVWDYNRAASAYQHSMQGKKYPLYGVAVYKYAWTLFKQQRYEAATKTFVQLLLYTDQMQKERGDPGADFRGEAYTYIAGSLTNIDFKGPDPSEPYIARPDIVDTEPRPEVAELKLHIAVDRVKDPNLIPQDKTWTIEIYKALAGEFRSLNQFNNAIEVYADILKKWPMDPTAPDVQAAIAETYDQLNVTKKVGTPEHDKIAAKALEARTMLANYIGNTPWTDANKDNPAALQNAERLVRGGLRLAAAQHTNNGKAQLIAAGQTGDPSEQADHLSRALSEYKLAALGWQGFLKQDENAPDAYDSRFWLADSKHNQVRIEVLLHKLKKDKFPEPSTKEVDEARAAAIDVRDSNEDDKYLEPTAFFAVDESDIGRDVEYQRWVDTKGSSGIEQRTEVKFDSQDVATKKVISSPVPPAVLNSLSAREEYVQRVPPNLDVNKRAMEYQYYAAETFFLYGNFDDAKARFEPMYRDHCGKDEFGYKAWEKLITMSNLSRDGERSRQLAEAEKNHSCAVSEEQKVTESKITLPTLQEAFYQDAAKVFEAACKRPAPKGDCVPQDSPPNPERDKQWRQAAALYEGALKEAPGNDHAPEAAIYGAFAYKQVGEFGKAIDMYNLFISAYGSEAVLSKLDKGDGKNPPEPAKYRERVKFLGEAYTTLSKTYYGFFNYQRAAETYEKIGSISRFDEKQRKDAARNAMLLYANMGQRDKAAANYRTLVSLHPTADEKANADFLVADYDYKQWNSKGADTGSNHQSRQAAEGSLQGFYGTNRNNPAAARFAVEAAYEVFKMKKTAGDPSYKGAATTTITAWEFFRSHASLKDGKSEALQPPFSDFAAEAEYTLDDDEIHANYDYETGHHKYTGATEDILGKFDKAGQQIKPGLYQTDAKAAQKYDEKLEHITSTYPSLEWVPAAIARQGSLFDSLRTGLYNAVPPAIKYFTPQQEALLKQLENSGRQNLQDQADELRTTVKEGWRKKKDVELAAADELMVRRYATAVALARKYNVRNPEVTHAIARLAYFTDIIGNDKMREYVSKAKDANGSPLTYTNDMYLQSRPGLTATPAPVGEGLPVPVAP